MTIIDERIVRAPADTCFRVAADVEKWPGILPHYRRVRFELREGFGRGRVAMSAWRDFGGPLRYPTWWVSDMHSDEDAPAVHYTHVRGITSGMRVTWSFLPHAEGTHVRITHTWDGPAWPIIGGFAWRSVIAPYFVSAIAQRTLAGVGSEAERRAANGGMHA